jgi:hypothetical protein
MSDLDDARQAAWFSERMDDDVPARIVFNRGFDSGARWAIRTSSVLSPHVAKFIEMLILLGFDASQESG